MPDQSETAAARLLNQQPGLRERIRDSSDFKEWRRTTHRTLDVDGVEYFVAAGEPFVQGDDRLKDEDELMLEWAKLKKIFGTTASEGG